MRQQNSTLAFRISLSALMAALGVVIMLISNLIPVLTYVAPLTASLTLIPILVEFGRKYAWMTWCVTAALALLLCADREVAFFYLFIGYYPILKLSLDRIHAKPFRILAKLAVFTAAFLLLFLMLTFVLGVEDVKSEMVLSLAVYALLVFVMLLFDRVYDRLALLYIKRLRNSLVRKAPKI